jgi:hypothetical protein
VKPGLRFALAPRRASTWNILPSWLARLRALTLADAARVTQTTIARGCCQLTGHGPTVDDHDARGRPVYRCLRCFHTRPRPLPWLRPRKEIEG